MPEKGQKNKFRRPQKKIKGQMFNLDEETMRPSYTQVPRRPEAVLKAKGGHYERK